MMQCVVLDGNLLDEVDGNLLDEFINDENLMYLQSSSEVTEKEIPVSVKIMIKMVCHKAYAGL